MVKKHFHHAPVCDKGMMVSTEPLAQMPLNQRKAKMHLFKEKIK